MSDHKTFTSLGVDPFLTKALNAISIHTPTTVQQACIPQILAGRDCIGSAHTGSGKTVAFAVPIIQHLAQDPSAFFALVLTPTRELAFQIADQFRVLGASININVSVIVGGLDPIPQSISLSRSPHILIATPGRLAHHLTTSNTNLNLRRVQYLVLDEADRLLTPSFAGDLGVIVGALPNKTERKTLLFTATVTESVLKLMGVNEDGSRVDGKEKKDGEGPFVHLIPEELAVPSTLDQRYLFIPNQVRDVYLVYLVENLCTIFDIPGIKLRPTVNGSNGKLKRHGKGKASGEKSKEQGEEERAYPLCIIFVAHTSTAMILSSLLTTLGIPCTSLHSSLPQSERLSSLSSFRAHRTPILVCTDLGGRGLDIPRVSVVVNYDLPREVDDYIHRVGRTGRFDKTAGASEAGRRGGISVSLVGEGDIELVQEIEDRVGRMKEVELEEAVVLESMKRVMDTKREVWVGMGDKLGKDAKRQKEEDKRGGKKRRVEA